MSVVTAKALNSTLGKDDFKSFDVILKEQTQEIIDALNKKTDDIIEAENSITRISAAYPASVEKRYFNIGGNYGDTFSAVMPCDGSLYVYGGGNKKTVNIYIKDSLKSSNVTDAIIVFSKGEKVTITVNNEYEQGGSSDPLSDFYIYANVS